MENSVDIVRHGTIPTMKDMLLRQLRINGNQEPFHLVDLSCVRNKFLEWSRLLPQVQPFYAVKCNPDPKIIHTLKSLGTGFDCASPAEIKWALSAGVTPDKIVYANTVKQDSHLEYARSVGVEMTTFDNLAELKKVKAIYPEATLLLRICADDSHHEVKSSEMRLFIMYSCLMVI